jgi:hypothetical protein
VYITWWDNKTGDWQVLSEASTDNGSNTVTLESICASPVKTLKSQPSNTISVVLELQTSSLVTPSQKLCLKGKPKYQLQKINGDRLFLQFSLLNQEPDQQIESA